MNVRAVRTQPIIVGDKLFDILDKAIKTLAEGSVVAVTSKIVSICEGSVVSIANNISAEAHVEEKQALIEQEAEFFLPPDNTYHISFAIKNSILIASAGVDESNGNGYYVLWPSDPQKSANMIREYLIKRFSISKVGVIIVDSKTTPLRWGVTGVAIGHSGFAALNDYTGKQDIFGREFRYEKVNVADGLAASAVLAMGEGAEQTPIAVVEDVPFVRFQDRNPTKKELSDLKLSLETDVFGAILRSVKWKKGKS